MNRLSLVVALVTAVVLLILAGFSSLLSGENTESLPATACSEDQIETLQWGDPNTDLASCQQDCRTRYGLDPYTLHFRGSGGSSTGAYYLYAKCIGDCNRAFWNRFDRETDRLRKE